MVTGGSAPAETRRVPCRRQGVVLVIAGSDSGAGAGIQADIKTCAALGVPAVTAVTAITAQNTTEVRAVQAVSASLVSAQLEALADDFRVTAVKIGMLPDAAVASAVARALRSWPGRGDRFGRDKKLPFPIVLDPVGIATAGDRRLREPGVLEVLTEELLPWVTVLTPNAIEAGELCGRPPCTDEAALRACGERLLARGPDAVLCKGGHLPGTEAVDLLVTRKGVERFGTPRIEARNRHGTGCTLASALAAYLARGESLEAAVTRAREYLLGALEAADKIILGHGSGPLHHFFGCPDWPK